MKDQPPPKYWAFISYTSRDRRIARWLHKNLEAFRIPKEIQRSHLPNAVTKEKRLRPVFRDRDELKASGDLSNSILTSLSNSESLIVLCSPAAAQSNWVNQEILLFKEHGRGRQVLPAIIRGEPKTGLKSSECFPPSLLQGIEPLAADFRRGRDGKQRAMCKLIASILRCDFDIVYRRHRRQLLQARAIRIFLILLSFLAAIPILVVVAAMTLGFELSSIGIIPRVIMAKHPDEYSETAPLAYAEFEKLVEVPLYENLFNTRIFGKDKHPSKWQTEPVGTPAIIRSSVGYFLAAGYVDGALTAEDLPKDEVLRGFAHFYLWGGLITSDYSLDPYADWIKPVFRVANLLEEAERTEIAEYFYTSILHTLESKPNGLLGNKKTPKVKHEILEKLIGINQRIQDTEDVRKFSIMRNENALGLTNNPVPQR